jgi:hypothetical protein
VARLPWKHFRTPPEPIVVGVFGVAAGPELRANEAPSAAKITGSARASLTEMVDMGESSMIKFTRTPNAGEAHLGSQSVDTTKLKFIERRETHQQ